MRIDGDGISQFKTAVAHRPAVRKQHSAAIGSIDMQPHSFAIGDAAQLADCVHRSGISRAKDTDDAHRPDLLPLVLGDGVLERIEAHAKFIVGGQRTQCRSAHTSAVHSFVYRDMALFRRVNRPGLMQTIMLRAIFRSPIARQLKADEVGHHAAAGKVSASRFSVAREIGEPAHRSPLHGDG